MLKVVDNVIWRDTTKIGILRANRLFTYGEEYLGYFESSHIYDKNNNKVGWVEGDYVHTAGGEEYRLEDNRAHIQGEGLNDFSRAAIRVLLGD